MFDMAANLSTPEAASRNALLAAFAADALRRVGPHLETVRLQRGDTLYEVGETIRHVWFPEDCVVSLTVDLGDGIAAETAAVGREGAIGCLSALGDRRATSRSTVQIEGAARRLRLGLLLDAFEAVPASREICMRYVQALFGQLSQSAACNALHPVEARLCRWLLMLHDRAGSDRLRLTQENVARLAAVQRSTVSAALGALRRRGLIDTGRGRLEIRDRAGLEADACECYAAIRALYARLLPPRPG